MAKKKKNGNYDTEKRRIIEEEKAKAKKAAKTKKILAEVGKYAAIVLITAALIVGLGFLFGWWGAENYTPTYHASIEIEDYGTLHLELYGEEAPETVENFVKLANDGFYDGLTFHRIIQGFMAQGGDPEGTGNGGSPDKITGEFTANGFDNPISHTRGTISMARTNDMNGASSQFFIVQEDSPHLDGNYAAFGRVIEGMDIIDKICEDAEPTDNNGTIPRDQQPKIVSISIHEAH